MSDLEMFLIALLWLTSPIIVGFLLAGLVIAVRWIFDWIVR